MGFFKTKPEVQKPKQEQEKGKSLEQSNAENTIKQSVEKDPASKTLEKVDVLENAVSKKLAEVRAELSRVLTIDYMLKTPQKDVESDIRFTIITEGYNAKLALQQLYDKIGTYKGKEKEITTQKGELKGHLADLEGTRQAVNLLRDEVLAVVARTSEFERFSKEMQKAERASGLKQEGGGDRLNDAQADLALIGVEIALRQKSLAKKVSSLELAGL